VKFKVAPSTPGWLVALVIHGVILAVPVSFLATQKAPWREIEFQLTEEVPLPPVPQPRPAPRPKPVSVLRDRLLKAEPAPPVRVEEKTPVVPEKAWVEPAVPTGNPAATVTAAEPAGRPAGEAKVGNPGGGSRGGMPGGSGGPDNYPHFLHREMPVYPAAARRMGREGKVVLRLFIDEAGKLQNVEVVESNGFEFTRSAVEAVKKSTYRPALQNGHPVPSRAVLPVLFILKEE
jgi:periplasmic protein TonB